MEGGDEGQKLTSTRETFSPLPSFVPASIFHPTTSWREDYLSDTNYVLSPPNCGNDKMGHVKVNVGHLRSAHIACWDTVPCIVSETGQFLELLSELENTSSNT